MPASGGTFWAVWSPWRGDRLLLLRVLRAMEQVVTTPGTRPARASVEVLVRDDVECYSSGLRFLREAPPGSTARFECLRVSAEGGQGRVELTLRRVAKRDQPRGVTLRAVSDDPEWAEDTVGELVPTITRGALGWTWLKRPGWLSELVNYKPDTGHRGGARKALERRNQRRRVYMTVAAMAEALPLIVLLCFAGLALDWPEALALGLIPLGLAVVAGLATLHHSVTDLVLPAIEIADRTPGRRRLTQLAAIGAPAIALIRAVAGG